jgi:hypothetical protein
MSTNLLVSSLPSKLASLFAGSWVALASFCEGAPWEAVNSGTLEDIRSVVWDGARFVAVAESRGILESNDGRTWTRLQLPSVAYYDYHVLLPNCRAVLVGNGRYLVLDEAEFYWDSSDRNSWVLRSSGQSKWMNGGVWGNGKFVLVGESGAIITSTDGLSWERNMTSPTTSELERVAFGKGLFVAGGFAGLFTSPDAQTWTPRATGALFPVTDVAVSAQRFVAVTWGEVLTSTDGITWARQMITPLTGPPYPNAICSGGSKFVIVCPRGKAFETTNGQSCVPIDLLTTSDINDVAYGAGMFVAVGDGGLIRVSGAVSNGAPPAATASKVLALTGKKTSLLLTGSDPDGDTLTYAVVAGPLGGILQGTAPNLTYTPRRGFVGTDSFSFVVSDGLEESAPATFEIEVRAKNRAPVASAFSLRFSSDVVAAILLSGTDADKDDLNFRVALPPSHGILKGVPPNLTYHAPPGFVGFDRFTYIADDGIGISKPALVSISVRPVGWVNGIPAAFGQVLSSTTNKPLRIRLGGVDSDVDPLLYQIVDPPKEGILKGKPPNLTYVPGRDFLGTDRFSYRVSDGEANSPLATVEITVAPKVSPAAAVGRKKAEKSGSGLASNGLEAWADTALSIRNDPSLPGSIVLMIQGAPNALLSIQFSSDLSRWSDLQAIALDDRGGAVIHIPISAHPGSGFFRLAFD